MPFTRFNGSYDGNTITPPWTGIQAPTNRQPTVVTDPATGSGLVGRFELQANDSVTIGGVAGHRNEVFASSSADPSPYKFYAGDTSYHRFSIMFSSAFASGWGNGNQMVKQIHHDGTGLGPIDIRVLDANKPLAGHIAVVDRRSFNYDTGMKIYWASPQSLGAPGQVNIWHNFVLAIHWSADNTVGWIEVHYSTGEARPARSLMQAPRRSPAEFTRSADGYRVTTATAASGTGMGHYVKQGYYSGGDFHFAGVVYHKDYVHDTTLAAVLPSENTPNPALAPEKAVDGDIVTRWGSDWLGTAWFQIDLGSVRNVSEVRINWENSYATGGNIVPSDDGVNFKAPVATITHPTGMGKHEGVYTFPEIQTRYLRINLTSRADTRYGYSFYEVKVLGTQETFATIPETVLKYAKAKPSIIVLRGINDAGGEFGTPGPTTATGTFSNQNPGVYDTHFHYSKPGTINFLASRGVKLIRLPFRLERLFTPSGTIIDAERDRITRYLNDAQAAGVQVILDAHNYGAYYVFDGTQGVRRTVGSAEFPRSAFSTMCKTIYATWNDHAAFLGMGLMNEPVDIPESMTLSGTEKLANGGFEVDTSDWVATANTTLARSTSTVHAGTGSAKLTAVAAGEIGIESTKKAVGLGETIVAETYARHNGTARTVGIQLNWFTSAGAYISTTSGRFAANTAAFEAYRVKGVAPTVAGGATADAAQVSVKVLVQTVAAAEAHRFDSFSMGVGDLVTGAKSWEISSREAFNAIRTVSAKDVFVGGYFYSTAKNWTSHHTEPWISGSGVVYEAHYYPDRDNSGHFVNTYAAEVLDAEGRGFLAESNPDALHTRVKSEIKTFLDWCAAKGVRGYIGEIGVPSQNNVTQADAEKWAALLDALYGDIDIAKMHVTQWTTGEWWNATNENLAYQSSTGSSGTVDTVNTAGAILEEHLTDLVFAPSATINDSTPSFTAKSNDAAAYFEYQIDTGPWSRIEKFPLTPLPLADGARVVRIRAVNAAGADATPAEIGFTVSTATTAPVVASIDGPSSPSSLRDALISWTRAGGNPTTASYVLSIDGTPQPAVTLDPLATSVSLQNLRDANYIFNLTLTNAAGVSSKSYFWAVDVPLRAAPIAPLEIGSGSKSVSFTWEPPADFTTADLWYVVANGTVVASSLPHSTRSYTYSSPSLIDGEPVNIQIYYGVEGDFSAHSQSVPMVPGDVTTDTVTFSTVPSFIEVGTGGSTDVKTVKLTVTAEGTGTPIFDVADNAPWMAITPTTGTAPQELLVTLDPTGLTQTTHEGTITIKKAASNPLPTAPAVSVTSVGKVSGEATISIGPMSNMISGDVIIIDLNGAFHTTLAPGTTSYTFTGRPDNVQQTVVVKGGTPNTDRIGPGTQVQFSTYAPSPPINTALPTISGTLNPGQVLTATDGTWHNSPTGYAYQWQRSKGTWTNIAGATGKTYTLISDDQGYVLRVQVVATNPDGATSALSEATGTVTTPAQPNLVPNPSADVDVLQWRDNSGLAGSVLERDTSIFTSGPAGFRITNTALGDAKHETAFMSVVAETTYVGRVMVRNSGTARTCGIQTNWFSDTDYLTTTQSSFSQDTGTFVERTITTTAPVGATRARFAVVFANTPAAEPHYFDDADFRKQ